MIEMHKIYPCIKMKWIHNTGLLHLVLWTREHKAAACSGEPSYSRPNPELQDQAFQALDPGADWKCES